METKELRGLCNADVVRALDALALIDGEDRTAYVNKVLAKHVQQRVHEASLLHSMLRGNPLLADTAGFNKE